MNNILKTLIICCVLGAIIFTTACTREVIKYEPYPVITQTVPRPPDISRPDLPIIHLTILDIENTEKVVKAYIVTVLKLRNYTRALERVIQVYTNLSETLANDEKSTGLLPMSLSKTSGKHITPENIFSDIEREYNRINRLIDEGEYHEIE